MLRRRCKIKSVDEIKTLDSSSVRRLCSLSLPERREEALREVVRRAAQWDKECQDYARKLRAWEPQNVLRCLEGEPPAVGFVPPSRELCLPSSLSSALESGAVLQFVGEQILNEAWEELRAVSHKASASVTLRPHPGAGQRANAGVLGSSASRSFAAAVAVALAAAVLAASRHLRRVRGGRRWR